MWCIVRLARILASAFRTRAEYSANITAFLKYHPFLPLRPLPDTSIFPRDASSRVPLLRFGPCTSMALINTASERIRFFTSPRQKYVALICAPCSPRSRETGVPPDWWTKRDIYLVSAPGTSSGTYSPGFFRPRQDSLTPWWQYYILDRRDALFCRGGSWIRNKGPGGKVVESGGSSAPQRLLQLERETTARTGSRAERENCGECVKYNVTEGLPKCVATPVVLYTRWTLRQMRSIRGLAIWLRFFASPYKSKRTFSWISQTFYRIWR